MIAVIFEVAFKPGKFDEYYDIALSLRPEAEKVDGFISVERFASVTEEGKYVSISYWRDEDAVAQWKAHMQHHAAQDKGKAELFSDSAAGTGDDRNRLGHGFLPSGISAQRNVRKNARMSATSASGSSSAAK